MKLVLIRHARAETRALLRRDTTRAVTAAGARRMRKAARGLRNLVPEIHHIATSPLLRARQTAEIVGRRYPAAERSVLAALKPGTPPRDTLAWLREQPAEATLALVGHEPDLGTLAAWLLSGSDRHFVHFKKGAVALIEFPNTPRAGAGVLLWLLGPQQLAALV